MEPLIGDFVQPLPRLTIHVSQAGEHAQGPEVLAQVSDAGALHLALLPRRGHMAGAREEAKLTGKGEETGMKANQIAFVFGHGRGQAVANQMALTPPHPLTYVNLSP